MKAGGGGTFTFGIGMTGAVWASPATAPSTKSSPATRALRRITAGQDSSTAPNARRQTAPGDVASEGCRLPPESLPGHSHVLFAGAHLPHRQAQHAAALAHGARPDYP